MLTLTSTLQCEDCAAESCAERCRIWFTVEHTSLQWICEWQLSCLWTITEDSWSGNGRLRHATVNESSWNKDQHCVSYSSLYPGALSPKVSFLPPALAWHGLRLPAEPSSVAVICAKHFFEHIWLALATIYRLLVQLHIQLRPTLGGVLAILLAVVEKLLCWSAGCLLRGGKQHHRSDSANQYQEVGC